MPTDSPYLLSLKPIGMRYWTLTGMSLCLAGVNSHFFAASRAACTNRGLASPPPCWASITRPVLSIKTLTRTAKTIPVG